MSNNLLAGKKAKGLASRKCSSSQREYIFFHELYAVVELCMKLQKYEC
jgi:hypothetical protein